MKSIYLLSLLTFFNSNLLWAQNTTTDVGQAYQDIKGTLGILPSFMKNYPQDALAGAWEEMKGVQLNPNSIIPGKYKDLIGLALAAQIPCRYCTYFHTEVARMYGANQEEINEAIAVAAQTRRWSTFLTGIQIDVGEYRSEIDKMLMYVNKHQNLQAMELEPKSERKLQTPEDVYKEVRGHYGFVPNFIKQYPANSIVGAWKDIKGIQFNPNSEIPGKYKHLIGLAVSAQIPCMYSIYYHTQSAIMQGATKEELVEASGLAGTVRSWSTVLNGHLVDENKFKNEVDQIVKYLKKTIPKEVSSN